MKQADSKDKNEEICNSSFMTFALQPCSGEISTIAKKKGKILIV